MKCSKCKKKAIVEVKWKKRFYCQGHYIAYFLGQVRKVIDKYKINKNSKICVALSGGKDSTAVLSALLRLGFKNIFCLHITPDEDLKVLSNDLGNKFRNFSKNALKKCKEICKFFNVPLEVVSLKNNYGISLFKLFEENKEKTYCKVCSTIRRYVLSDYGYKKNFDYIVTGHNLSDVTAHGLNTLLNNYFIGFAHLLPLLEKNEEFKLVARLKPLFFLTDNEIKFFMEINKFPYFCQRCPLALKSPPPLYAFKKNLNLLEKEKPGILRKFVYSYMELGEKIKKLSEDKEKTKKCKICGYATLDRLCSFCKLMKRHKRFP